MSTITNRRVSTLALAAILVLLAAACASSDEADEEEEPTAQSQDALQRTVYGVIASCRGEDIRGFCIPQCKRSGIWGYNSSCRPYSGATAWVTCTCFW